MAIWLKLWNQAIGTCSSFLLYIALNIKPLINQRTIPQALRSKGLGLWIFLFGLLWNGLASAQMLDPVRWTTSITRVNDSTARLIMDAKIDEGWHLYSQFMKFGPDQFGPEPTVFQLRLPAGIRRLGVVQELSKVHEEAAPLFDGLVVRSFERSARFAQDLRVYTASAAIEAKVSYMACDDRQCLAPQERSLRWKLEGYTNKADTVFAQAEPTAVDTLGKQEIRQAKPATNTPKSQDSSGWLTLFLAGFAGGLLALLTPCVFPMIPLTVSYFTKQGGTKGRTWTMALGYGLSIVVIYVALGMGVTLLFGSDALNNMASNIVFNLVFFGMLLVFGFSFLGAFEITLPSSWTNKADRQADKGGWGGLFFMAFTLALVSFSCTGPIIGTLLVEAAVRGSLLGPAVGMLGFSLALALPFTLFAVFPNWLQQLPRSGSWMNSVKVVLGFLELAFALKFLSNVDLAYHWGILDREIFLVLWIAIFTLLSLYLLGFIRFSHDSPMAHLGLVRMTLAIASIAFTLYLVPGLWGAPLHAVNAFVPPLAGQDFVLGTTHGPSSGTASDQPVAKYSDILHAPHNLPSFFDYEEGMAYARRVNKPVMLDFTGHSCVNCRKMEASVWVLPDILERLRNEVVLISLYVDDKTPLPASEQYRSAFSGQWIDQLGARCSDLQASLFQTNSQPYYVLLDHEGKSLAPPASYDPDPALFRSFLDEGIRQFKEKSATR